MLTISLKGVLRRMEEDVLPVIVEEGRAGEADVVREAIRRLSPA